MKQENSEIGKKVITDGLDQAKVSYLAPLESDLQKHAQVEF